MALESQIGSLAGTGIGMAVGGPLGATLGAGLGGIAGGLIGKARQSEPEVPMVDPAQVARMKEIQQTRDQISQGRDPLTQMNISEIKKTGETTKGQLGKFTGGDVGATLSAFLRAQRNTGKNINSAFAQSQQRLPFFENLQSQLGNRIAQRKLELGINTQDTARAKNAQSDKLLNTAISGTIATLPALIGGGGNGQVGGGASSVPGAGQSPIDGMNSLGQTQLPVAPPLQVGDMGGQFQQGISNGGNPGFQQLGNGFQL